MTEYQIEILQDEGRTVSLRDSLKIGANGGNLLFCGAGFSADCLNFGSEALGSASPLHKTLNDAVGYEFSDMQLAADEFIEKSGEHGLLRLLSEKYSISRRTKDVDEILRYPWTRIYTTNYDNVISQALTAIGRPHYVANNLESPAEIRKHSAADTWVVHLHGALEKWDIRNFLTSCVLGRESYIRASANSNWATMLREDYARANAIFFVGFSNSDFYLAESLYSAEAAKAKVYLINSDQSAADRELLAKQKNYGTSFALGKEGFSEEVSRILTAEPDELIELHSFEKFTAPEASEDRASVAQQEAFMLNGRTSLSHHFRDILDNSHSYRAERPVSDCISEFMRQPNSVSLILEGICSGKSLIFDETVIKLVSAGETVFKLRAKFYDLVPEVERIIGAYPRCILAIDNCFSLKADFRSIIRLGSESEVKFLLASRSLAYDSEPDLRSQLSDQSKFEYFSVDILTEFEGDALIDCADRIAVWGANVAGRNQKKRILEVENSSRLSSFLLGTFRSQHIRGRFLSELDKIRSCGNSIERALIIALYLKSIGEGVQENVLSELLVD